MKKNKLLPIVLSALLVVTLSPSYVKADDFAGQEDHYIELCSSENLTAANKKTCESFNAYLKQKNKDIKEQLQKSQANLNDTNAKLKDIESQLNTLDQQIAENQKSIDYLTGNIKQLQLQIHAKKEKLKERFYSMQGFYNTNFYIDYVINARSITEFFSRLASMGDISDYENELIDEIKKDQKTLTTQLDSLTDAKANLEVQKDDANTLRTQYVDLAAKQAEEISQQQQQHQQINEAQAKVDAALNALMSRAPEGSITGSITPGPSETGNAIANAAISQLGKRYWWGATGPDYYDCSGLVYWAHNNAGIAIPRLTAAGYATSGQDVSRSELQTGDVITFNYGKGVAHIGIYIGNDQFVQASGRGSGTVGQYADQCVKITPLSGYWSRYIYNYRRLY